MATTADVTVKVDLPPQRVAFIRRSKEHAAACREILGLPDDAFTGVEIEFGTDDIAVARVGIILRPDQLVALAELAANSVDGEGGER